MKRAVFFVLATLSAITAPAFAGERTNLGAIPALPNVKDAESPPPLYGVPGLTLKEEKRQRSSSSYYTVTAATAQGYCFVNREDIFELEGSTTNEDAGEMWHLVEKDGGATLERIRYQIASYVDNAWVKSKTSVTLKELATDQGVTAWGMRDVNGDVVVLAKRAVGGREARPASVTSGIGFVSSTCTYGATRINAALLKTGGGAAQLSGRLPAVGEGKDKVEPQFVIDISAVKVSRDPEPVISVRIRRDGKA